MANDFIPTSYTSRIGQPDTFFGPPVLATQGPINSYYPNVDGFCLDDINLRYDVVRTFLEHPVRVSKMLLQSGSQNSDGSIFTDSHISIILKPPKDSTHQMIAGSWIDHDNCRFGTDIVSLYAYKAAKSYHAALHELWTAFGNKEFLRNCRGGVKWHIQEKNSIVLYDRSRIIDNFCLYFDPHPARYLYHNKYGRIIGGVYKFNLIGHGEAEIFYTTWRRPNSEEEKIASLFPEKPYMIYNQHLINEDVKFVLFESNEKLADDYRAANPNQHDLVPSACPGGLKNLINADFSSITNQGFIVRLGSESFDFSYFDALAKKCQETGGPGLLVQFPFSEHLIGTNAIFSDPERYGLHAPAVEIKKIPGLAGIGEELPNAKRQMRMLVDPIIESGSITWLFAPEKAGKTLLGLSIAYAAGKGNRPIGAWHVKSPCNVLYIDGEMPTHKSAQFIDKIMQGYNDNSGQEGRPFAFYSFLENNLEYDSILDEEWQKKLDPEIANFDLVILDNYYSLNENRLNIRPFIRWMKSHTRNKVAFLVLDHTNSEGELQGSLIKRRAADLGIELQKASTNEINISYQFDRYGVENKSTPHALIPCFTATEFHFEMVPEASKTPKKLNDKLSLYAYLLALQDKGKTPTEITHYTGMNRATVDNYLNAFRHKDDLTPSQIKYRSKVTDEDKTLVNEAKRRFIELTDEELGQELDCFQHSPLSRLFQD